MTLFSAKKGGGDLERHFDLQPISAKKGGGDLARHLLFLVKIVYSIGILKNREKFDFGTEIFWAKKGGGLSAPF